MLLIAAASADAHAIAPDDTRACCLPAPGLQLAQAETTPAPGAELERETAEVGRDGDADFGRAVEEEFLLLDDPADPVAFEQTGPELSPEEERAAIADGWQ